MAISISQSKLSLLFEYSADYTAVSSKMALRKAVAGKTPVALTAARCLATHTVPPAPEVDLGPAWGLKGGRDRETEDEATFRRPFHFLKTNQLPPWPRTTGVSHSGQIIVNVTTEAHCSSYKTLLYFIVFFAAVVCVLCPEIVCTSAAGMTEVRGPFTDVMGKRRMWVRMHLRSNDT